MKRRAIVDMKHEQCFGWGSETADVIDDRFPHLMSSHALVSDYNPEAYVKRETDKLTDKCGHSLARPGLDFSVSLRLPAEVDPNRENNSRTAVAENDMARDSTG